MEGRAALTSVEKSLSSLGSVDCARHSPAQTRLREHTNQCYETHKRAHEAKTKFRQKNDRGLEYFRELAHHCSQFSSESFGPAWLMQNSGACSVDPIRLEGSQPVNTAVRYLRTVDGTSSSTVRYSDFQHLLPSARGHGRSGTTAPD